MRFRFAYDLLSLPGKNILVKQKGKAFYSKYRKIADDKLKEIETILPQIKDSNFDFNYKFIAAYVPIYYSLL